MQRTLFLSNLEGSSCFFFDAFPKPEIPIAANTSSDIVAARRRARRRSWKAPNAPTDLFDVMSHFPTPARVAFARGAARPPAGQRLLDFVPHIHRRRLVYYPPNSGADKHCCHRETCENLVQASNAHSPPQTPRRRPLRRLQHAIHPNHPNSEYLYQFASARWQL